MKYNPAKIERKWQKYWESRRFYHTRDSVKGKKNFMLLTEFAYPSGNLHIGHWLAFSVPDILARYLKMNGNNVLYPTGFDAFGLPAENAAIQRNINPRDWTKDNIKQMTKQLKSTGAMFDWSRAISTIDPEYYRWTQWIFLKMYERGLVYRKKTFVNWCPKDKTVLANEQVKDGRCDRCGTEVEQKELFQWMFKITDYADRLIDDLDKVDYPKTVKVAQRNWIGRSEGALIKFPIFNSKFSKGGQEYIEVFTTRADTLFGATYLVLAPEHPMVTKLTEDGNLNAVSKYLEEVKKKTEMERLHIDKSKTGVNTGGYVVNPINNEKIPVWVADYVIGWYGTGTVMAVPAHDERDFEFAKKFDLPIKMVVCPHYPAPTCPVLEHAFTEDAHLVDSAEFTGIKSAEARNKIVEKLKEKGLADFKKNYKLHDWVLSRQRYWGVPIPTIRCDKCGYQPVSEKDLPVELPELADFKPTDDGRSPLAKAEDWVNAECPKCGQEAKRETDTMDTFVDSSWYFLRYADPENKKEFADKKKLKIWLPVPIYIGGAEHNTMHLLYSRFITKALHDLGYLDFVEPFSARRNHGIILGPDNQKMSKSRGNVINPDIEVKKYGADAIRMYLAFMGPYEQGGAWNPKGIQGVSRFLNRVWTYFEEWEKYYLDFPITSLAEAELLPILNKTIKGIQEDIENNKFNTAVSKLMILMNKVDETIPGLVSEEPTGGLVNYVSEKDAKIIIKLLAPFAPHIAEELWQSVLKNKKSIHMEKWPKYDEALLAEEPVELVIQINGVKRDVFKVTKGLSEEEVKNIVLNNENIKKYLVGKEIKKFIYIKDRLTNIVI
ncbi:MAG: leucine--tRNA ligase [Candidatus Yanofskybacteria bacterium]|nr:leucine--tRNA ligase [Candidatus Yanofskybacteria bacterium]